MNRASILIVVALPLLLAGCYSDQKKQLAACEGGATRTGDGQPLKSIQLCMDQHGYRFIAWDNSGGETVVCDLAAVVRGAPSASGEDAKCFEPKSWLALQVYRMQMPVRLAPPPTPEN